MTVDELRLGVLHRKLDEVLGPEDAATLITLLRETQGTGPTTDDLVQLAASLRQEMRAAISELRSELASRDRHASRAT